MRSLATGAYTHAQVVAQLKGGHYAHGPRFDVLDNNHNIVGALSTVTAATVEHDVDRRIKGSLTLTMQPDPALVSQFYRRRIRPWFRIRMPDGGIAEWPMGVYPWLRPKRKRTQRGLGEWTITLGDQLMLLDAGGPGVTGLYYDAGTTVRHAVLDVLRQVGVTDASGVSPIETQLSTRLGWSLAAAGTWTYADTQPKKLLDIIAQLHDGAGVYGPWFDLTGRYRLQPVPDLTRVAPTFTYATDSDSIMGGFETDENVDHFANRVVVRTSGAGQFIGTSTADADVIAPGHPGSHAVIGLYIDVPLDNSVATTQVELDRQARSELHQRLSFDQAITLPTQANPSHEAYDVIGLRYDGDEEFASVGRLQERRWAMNLFTGEMDHKLNRLYSVVA